MSMNLARRLSGRLVLAAAAVVSLAGAPAVQADPVDLSLVPLDVSAGTPPNVVVSFDDSGSMMATALPDSVADVDNNIWKEVRYYSSTTNTIYFDPKKTYPPPPKPDGSSFPNATYSKAWRDGMCANWSGSYCAGSAATVDLGAAFYDAFVNGTSTGNSANDNGQYDIPSAVRGGKSQKGGFWYDCPNKNSNADCTLNLVKNASAAFQQQFANWYSYYRTRNLQARTAMARAFVSVDTSIRVVWQNINNKQLGSSSKIKALSGSWRDDFFSWLYSINQTGSTPLRAATLRAGDFYTRKLTKDDLDPYWNGLSGKDSDDVACRQNFHMLVTDGYWNENDPSGLPSPMQTIDKSVTLPDGQDYTPGDVVSKIISNVSGSTYNSSLANIAWHYWATDLQPSLANKIKPHMPDITTGVTGTKVTGQIGDPLTVPEIYWNPANDPATWQHMVQYMVTLGVAGTLDFPGDYTALRKGTATWPKPKNNSPEAVDDTWHAAVSSRGKYFSASHPQDLVDSLSSILASIVQRSGSTAAASVSSGVLNNGTEAFRTGYDSTNWSGFVNSLAVNPDTGALGSVNWSAIVPEADKREILTTKGVGAGNGIAFRWSSLNAQQQTWLNTNPATSAADTSGSDRLDWLRGDPKDEGSKFRSRSSVLGAVVNSQAVYVSYPTSSYRDIFPDSSPEGIAAAAGKTYEQFAYDNRERQPVLYVGANDGMLHAFAAKKNTTKSVDAGDELWAYAPYSVFDNLNKLTDPAYTFQPYVDSTPLVRDVFYDGAWHTLLVGGLRYGGRGVFALDVTDPQKVRESSASSSVLWEFSNLSTGGANLGYTFGNPNIARMPGDTKLGSKLQERWVVVIPGGYFPVGSTDSAANNKQGSLFFIDAEKGTLLTELKTPAGVTSYGLASVVLGDYDDDQIDDVAFAGDALGNLWRFDLHSGAVDQVFQPDIAGEQPITVMPRLFPDPATQKLVVVFGTGKYLGDKDRLVSSIKTQAVYGIRDYGPGSANYPAKRADLVQQKMVLDGKIRALTDKAVSTKEKGWYFLLDQNAGESVVSAAGALFNSNRAIIATLIPGGSDPCNPGRKGAIMVIDAANGGPADGPPVVSGGKFGAGYTAVGTAVVDPPVGGTMPAVTQVGGGKIILPGITLEGGTQPFAVADSYWRRRSWRPILDTQ